MGINFTLDEQNTIIAVGGDWDQFALDNGAPELLGDKVIGRLLLDFVSGNVTRQFVIAILNLVRSNQPQIELEYRCDSPSQRRFMLMKVANLGEGKIRFQNDMLHIEPRNKKIFISRAQQRGRHTSIRCSMCNLINTQRQWLEPDFLKVDRHAEFEELIVVYGICESCSQQLTEADGFSHTSM